MGVFLWWLLTGIGRYITIESKILSSVDNAVRSYLERVNALNSIEVVLDHILYSYHLNTAPLWR